MNFRYDIWTGYQLDHHGEVSVPVHPDRIPVYQRGGTIIPKKERISSVISFDGQRSHHFDDRRILSFLEIIVPPLWYPGIQSECTGMDTFP